MAERAGRQPRKLNAAWGNFVKDVEKHDNDEVVKLQKGITDYFQLWRNGNDLIYNYVPADREKHLGRIKFPRTDKWQGHIVKPRGIHYGIRKRRNSNLDYDSQKQQRLGQDRSRRMDDQLRCYGFEVRRVLGFGSGGLACEVVGKDQGGRDLRLVCKTAWGGEQMVPEKEKHVLMAGARHIVQRVVLGGKPELDRQEFAEREGIRLREVKDSDWMTPPQELDAREDLLFIEFMRNGDLETLLAKAAEAETPFPDLVLWQIFDCLFKGVVAMAFPGRWNRSMGDDPKYDNLRPVTERPIRDPIVAGAQRPGPLVHFDLNPNNIFLGDFDDTDLTDEHKLVPLLKIADFGLAQIVDQEFRKDVEKMWQWRKYGRPLFVAPEQFTEEWDWIKGVPIDEDPDQDQDGIAATAGNYDWWTNLYQVGQVMWQLITLRALEWPRTAQRAYCHVDVEGGPGEFKHQWTYGSWLSDPQFERTDWILRNLVMRCMNHKPAERPSMADMDRILGDNLRGWRRQIHDAGAAAAREFCAKMFAEPAPAAAEPANLANVQQDQENVRPKHHSHKAGVPQDDVEMVDDLRGPSSGPPRGQW